MSGLPTPSAVAEVWPRAAGSTSTSTGPIPFGGGGGGGGPSGLPVVNNPNLPSYSPLGGGNLPPPIPQPPTTPFPTIRPTVGLTNSTMSNNYATANTLPPINPPPVNLAGNPMENAQNEAYQRRLTQLEDDIVQRRNNTANLAQMGTQLLQGQMEVQEQVLEYQYMLEECMNKLDNQNFVLNEQEEQLALLRSKIRHMEYLMDAFKYSQEGSVLLRNMSQDPNINDNNFACCGEPLSLPPPSTSPFYAGGPTRATPSTFQPFNPRYRSPNSRATTAANINTRRSVTPTINKPNLPTANERLSRRYGNVNN